MEPYIPEILPVEINKWNWTVLSKQLAQASRSLAYFDGILSKLVNPMLLLAPLRLSEAVYSSQIEGIQTTIENLLNFDVKIEPENQFQRNNVLEVNNYRQASQIAIEALNDGYPINLDLILNIHKELLSGVRGASKGPGHLGQEQNWIGLRNEGIEKAKFIPPEPLTVKPAMQNLLEYLTLEIHDPLVQTAFFHAQFELIHPFLDGNGRTGRILIPLILWHKKAISQPMFYLSEYFEANRQQYYQELAQISETRSWEKWVSFFLNAIIIQAEIKIQTVEKIQQLYGETRMALKSLINSSVIEAILDCLFQKPIFSSLDLVGFTGLTLQSSNRLIKILVNNNIVEIIRQASGPAPKVVRFNRLVKLLSR